MTQFVFGSFYDFFYAPESNRGSPFPILRIRYRPTMKESMRGERCAGFAALIHSLHLLHLLTVKGPRRTPMGVERPCVLAVLQTRVRVLCNRLFDAITKTVETRSGSRLK